MLVSVSVYCACAANVFPSEILLENLRFLGETVGRRSIERQKKKKRTWRFVYIYSLKNRWPSRIENYISRFILAIFNVGRGIATFPL